MKRFFLFSILILSCGFLFGCDNIGALKGTLGDGLTNESDTSTNCSNPIGSAGGLNYDSSTDVLQYCNGTNWVNLGTAGNSGDFTCTPEVKDVVSIGLGVETTETSMTFKYKPVDVKDGMLLVAIAYEDDNDGGATVSSVTHGGNPLAEAVSELEVIDSDKGSAIYYLGSPATTLEDIVVTMDATIEHLQAVAMTVSCLKDQAPEAIASAEARAVTSSSVNITTVTSDAFIIDVLEHGDRAAASLAVSSGPDQVEILKVDSASDPTISSSTGVSYMQAGAIGMKTLGWTSTPSNSLAQSTAAFEKSLSTQNCIEPVGVGGDTNYDQARNVMQFCNGTDWVDMGPDGSANDCSPSVSNTITSATSSTTATDTISYTVAGGLSDSMMIVSIAFENDGANSLGVTSVTFDGDPLTEAITHTYDDKGASIFYLANPTAKTGNVIVTLDESVESIITGVTSAECVKSQAPETIQLSRSSDTDSSINIQSASDKALVFDVLQHGGTVGSTLAVNGEAGQTSLYNLDTAGGASSSSSASYYIAGSTGVHNMAWTSSASNQLVQVGVVFERALNAGTCSNPSSAEGTFTYHEDSNSMRYCDGANWVSVSP